MTIRPKVAAAPAPGTFTGRHMLLVMIAFFGVIIGVNITLAVFSSTTWSGLVVPNSYVASQQFQVKRDALAAQQALGWKPHFSYAPGAARFILSDAAGKPVDLGTVTIQVNRPIGTREDVNVQVAPGPDGAYMAEMNLGAGVWDALVSTPVTAQGPFEFRHRFSVDAPLP